MNERPDLLLSLLDGLDKSERQLLLDHIQVAHGEQLEQRRHPQRRRRRNADGELVWPGEIGRAAP